MIGWWQKEGAERREIEGYSDNLTEKRMGGINECGWGTGLVSSTMRRFSGI